MNGWLKEGLVPTHRIAPSIDRPTDPQTRFLVMGVLDCCGTFLAAMGAFYTPGSVQTLLNQTLIPVTMLCSAIYLRSRFTSVQLCGSGLVLLGALVTVVAPSLGQTGATAAAAAKAGPTGTGRWSAELLYFLSNIPVACSQVGKCGPLCAGSGARAADSHTYPRHGGGRCTRRSRSRRTRST